MNNTLAILADQLSRGQTTATELVNQAWVKYDASGDTRLFTVMLRDASLKAAEMIDQERAQGRTRTPFAGIPITVKDLFDIEGIVTTAGSRVLQDAQPAIRTAPCIQYLLDAGFIILGKVNMTEFAYSGLGLNPHFGTPSNPWSEHQELIPGGSSSGSAVSVAGGIVCASVGTDTGGSVRIPSSFCHLTGFKPGGSFVDQNGVIPLAQSLDSVGPLANSVRCCADLVSIMARKPLRELLPCDIGQLRFLVPQNSVWEQVEESVEQRSKNAFAQLEAAGATLHYRPVKLLDEILASGAQGIIAGYESHQWHKQLLQERADEYDPRVRIRLENGSRIPETDYEQAMLDLHYFREEFSKVMQNYDAVLWPAIARTAPRFDELIEDTDYDRINLLVLRNTAFGNVLDASSISLPMPLSTEHLQPAGLMLSSRAGDEDSLLQVALAVEQVLAEN